MQTDQIAGWVVHLRTGRRIRQFKSLASAGKVMLLLFWDCDGLLLELYFSKALLLLPHNAMKY